MNVLSTSNIGQILTILYYYVKIAIDGSTQEETQIPNLLIQNLNGYTLILDDKGKQLVSNSQRYKMLGNGWTISIISHIFRGLDGKNNK